MFASFMIQRRKAYIASSHTTCVTTQRNVMPIDMPQIPEDLKCAPLNKSVNFISTIKERDGGESQHIEVVYPLECPSQHCRGLIALDFDGVIGTPEKTSTGKYIQQADGLILAKLIDEKQFSALIKTAEENDVALMILTARANSVSTREFIVQCIEKAGGFHEGPGGFKKHLIYCAGKLVKQKDNELVWQEARSKVNVLQKVHAKKFSHLAGENICFADDMLYYLNPVAKLNTYRVLHVNSERQKTLSYFSELMILAQMFSLEPPASSLRISR